MNPYLEEQPTLKGIGDLFGKYVPQERFETRGDFLKYFSLKTGYTIPRLGLKLKGISDLKTLFHIKSVCDKYMLEGKKENYRHAFNSCLFVPAVDNSLHL